MRWLVLSCLLLTGPAIGSALALLGGIALFGDGEPGLPRWAVYGVVLAAGLVLWGLGLSHVRGRISAPKVRVGAMSAALGSLLLGAGVTSLFLMGNARGDAS